MTDRVPSKSVYQNDKLKALNSIVRILKELSEADRAWVIKNAGEMFPEVKP